MAYVINKETLEVRRSVHTPDYGDEWLINPELPSCEPIYWKIDGDRVVEMSAAEKAQVDAEALAASEATADQLEQEQLINEKLRDIAIAELVAEGTLAAEVS